MRHAPTRAERKVWWWLRDRQFTGYKFRRQVPIGRYIVDFYCVELELAIELDGPHHNAVDMSDYDSARTIFLRSRGIEVVRIPNALIDGDAEYGAECIRMTIAERSLLPSMRGEGAEGG
jgi:very-short-patch-repair endonuclease